MSELMSVKDQEESFCTHQSACEMSLWSLSYCSSKIDTGRQGGELRKRGRDGRVYGLQVLVDAAACRAYRDPGARNRS